MAIEKTEGQMVAGSLYDLEAYARCCDVTFGPAEVNNAGDFARKPEIVFLF